jgi:hypothetical protein
MTGRQSWKTGLEDRAVFLTRAIRRRQELELKPRSSVVTASQPAAAE